jgi:hypothetical protein
MDNPVEAQRLTMLMDSADAQAEATGKQLNDKQVELSKERTQYFEKIALGSGATIAAIVLFVGSHAAKLRPGFLLRSALIAFVASMITAMVRNWIYPYYVSAVFMTEYDKALLNQQNAKTALFIAVPTISIQTGVWVDISQWQANHAEVKAGLESKIDDFKRKSERTFRYSKTFESCQSFVGLRRNFDAGRSRVDELLEILFRPQVYI